MVSERSLWRSTRLGRPAGLGAARHRQPAAFRRSGARGSPRDPTTPPPPLRPARWPQSFHARFPVDEGDPSAAGADDDGLAGVLRAVQRQDLGQIGRAFVAWAAVLRDARAPGHADAVRRARELPATTFSEVVRCLDPVANPGLDVAHGINITPGMAQFTSACRLVDEFGVRRHHREVLAGMAALMEARAGTAAGVAPTDCEVMMRCAGAGVNALLGKRFWAAPARAGLQAWRTPKTWLEFVRGRFRTEPLYYQFDRARVAVLPRDLHRAARPLAAATLRRLDAVRLSLSALQFEPWNRQHWRADQDWRRALRRRGRDYRGFGAHFRRALLYGAAVDEEFLCVAMVAFARSGAHRAVRDDILAYHYGLRFADADADPAGSGAPHRRPRVSGGRALHPDSPLRPSPRLLDAIVEAFGAMSDIPLALALVQHVSRRFGVPVPARTWSSLLSWAYVCASRPLRQMRRLLVRDGRGRGGDGSGSGSGSGSGADADAAARRLVPDLVRDLAEFLPPNVVYRAGHGLVDLARPDAPRRWRWLKAWRTTLPARYGHAAAAGGPCARLPDEQWPLVQDMRVLGWHRLPALRAEALARAPSPPDGPRIHDGTGARDVAACEPHRASRWSARLRRELLL